MAGNRNIAITSHCEDNRAHWTPGMKPGSAFNQRPKKGSQCWLEWKKNNSVAAKLAACIQRTSIMMTLSILSYILHLLDILSALLSIRISIRHLFLEQWSKPNLKISHVQILPRSMDSKDRIHDRGISRKLNLISSLLIQLSYSEIWTL